MTSFQTWQSPGMQYATYVRRCSIRPVGGGAWSGQRCGPRGLSISGSIVNRLSASEGINWAGRLSLRRAGTQASFGLAAAAPCRFVERRTIAGQREGRRHQESSVACPQARRPIVYRFPLEKIRPIRALIGEGPIQLQVDRGVNVETAAMAAAAGADVLVAGSAVFRGGTRECCRSNILAQAAATNARDRLSRPPGFPPKAMVRDSF
jgi:hypothetical protein